jgi:hypothetical protein
VTYFKVYRSIDLESLTNSTEEEVLGKTNRLLSFNTTQTTQ